MVAGGARQPSSPRRPARTRWPFATSTSSETSPNPPRRVIVRPDAPPTVTRRGLEGLKEASPDDTLTVGVAARDDIAVASIELHYAIRRGRSTGAESETGHVAVKTEGLGSRSARGMASLEFHPLGLKPGDGLTYRLRVADNRPAPRGPNVVWTSPEEITIVAGAEPMLAQLSRLRRTALQDDARRLEEGRGGQSAGVRTASRFRRSGPGP